MTSKIDGPQEHEVCLAYNSQHNVFCKKKINHRGKHSTPILVNREFLWSGK